MDKSKADNEIANELKWPKYLFFGGVSSLALMSGFSFAFSASRNEDMKYYDKGMNKMVTMESGASFAYRALKRSTLYTLTGFSLTCLSIWLLSGAKDFKEFRYKIGSYMPKLSPEKHKGRTDFENLTEFMEYLNEMDSKK
ncbi:hypothetical protein SNEBB_001030 [Seison nebaliae]|nr:hypothetical protein SNEBB_001030 [Seison nebaliae]